MAGSIAAGGSTRASHRDVMKIAMATDWFTPRRGGIESQLTGLAERLAARGHHITVITSTPGATNGPGYAIRRVDGPRLPVAGIAVSPMLARKLREAIGGQCDLVHAHVSVVSPVGYLAALSAASRGIPAVVTFHSVLRLKRLVLAAANAVGRLGQRPIIWSAVSQLVAEQARRALGSVDVHTLPNGTDLDFWRETSGASTPDRRPVTFVSAMRLHRKKRPRELVAAFARAVELAGRPARLVLAGVGPEEPALRRDISAILASIDLVGWQDRTSLKALYAHADAFVLPSRREAFGLAALEARAAGLPVIASSAAGCREFLRHDHDALLCDGDDAFVAAMMRFIREPELRRRLAGAESRLERYDWEPVLAEHEKVYDLAMKATRRVLVPAAAPA